MSLHVIVAKINLYHNVIAMDLYATLARPFVHI